MDLGARCATCGAASPRVIHVGIGHSYYDAGDGPTEMYGGGGWLMEQVVCGACDASIATGCRLISSIGGDDLVDDAEVPIGARPD